LEKTQESPTSWSKQSWLPRQIRLLKILPNLRLHLYFFDHENNNTRKQAVTDMPDMKFISGW